MPFTPSTGTRSEARGAKELDPVEGLEITAVEHQPPQLADPAVQLAMDLGAAGKFLYLNFVYILYLVISKLTFSI